MDRIRDLVSTSIHFGGSSGRVTRLRYPNSEVVARNGNAMRVLIRDGTLVRCGCRIAATKLTIALVSTISGFAYQGVTTKPGRPTFSSRSPVDVLNDIQVVDVSVRS